MATKIFRALIMGAPASGKGTISSRILTKFNLKYVACGDILRQQIQLKTPLGIEAKKFIDKGQLVPDDLVIKCILNKINGIGNDSWLLDGFPRTIEQAEYLWNFQKVDAVINLIVPHQVIIERTQGRWVHLQSGRVYNTDFNKPKVPFRDDLTGDSLVQREDDRPETVRRRLQIYDDLTKPLTDYYQNHGILHEFAGNTSDEIWPLVERYLNKAIV